MTVQDDRRESQICSLLGFRRGGERSGVDAFYDFRVRGARYSVPLELKSTTSGSVSTARDVGPAHIEKWRSRVWVFAFYDRTGETMERLLALGQHEMEPWIGRIETYIAPDLALARRAAVRLTLEDLHIVCGEKSVYGTDDAKALYKRQWSKTRYEDEKDLPNGYSPPKMLEILRRRSEYLHHRGATLNNPHIPKGFFTQFDEKMIDVERQSPMKTKKTLRARIRASVIVGDEMREQGAR